MNSEAPPGRHMQVLVVEDDDALRDDFARAVAATPALQLMASTGSAREALRLLEAGPGPDVMLVDLGLPDGDGSTLIRALRQRAPAAKALVISVLADEHHVMHALACGAHGYLLKESSTEEIAQAIQDVLDGHAPLSPRIARYLLRQFERPDAGARGARPQERLSSREAQVLTLVSHGLSAQEIATRLALSLHTVNTHLRNCYAKLEAGNRVQALKRARDSGQIG